MTQAPSQKDLQCQLLLIHMNSPTDPFSPAPSHLFPCFGLQDGQLLKPNYKRKNSQFARRQSKVRMDGREPEFQRTDSFSLLQERKEFLLNSERVQLAKGNPADHGCVCNEEQLLQVHETTTLRPSFRDRIKRASGHPTRLWGALIPTQHPSKLPVCKVTPTAGTNHDMPSELLCHQII